MVTRETSISEGLSALGWDARHAPKLVRLAKLLETDAIRQGLLSDREKPRVVDRHILDSAALARFVQGDSFIDVGPGAGLPGLVVAILTGLRATLVESSARAAAFNRRMIAELEIEAEVVQASAEHAGRGPLREAFATAVSRALAPPPVALELMLPFVGVGGRAATLVGPSAAAEPGAAVTAARELGGRKPEYFSLEVPGVLAGRWVMIVDKVIQTAERYPRRPGVPRRRPLGGGVTGVS